MAEWRANRADEFVREPESDNDCMRLFMLLHSPNTKRSSSTPGFRFFVRVLAPVTENAQ